MAHQGPDFFKDVHVKARPIDAAAAPIANFTKKEAAGGIVLMAAAAMALVVANSGLGHAFHEFWTGTRITLNVGSWVFPSNPAKGYLQWWVNDALMAAFFFVIGLEIKREVLAGELREPRKAALPLIAAVGGLALPGAIYAALNWGGEGIRGWAIPAATDIAFALGVVALLGRRVPSGLRVFLVTLAIADDLGALIIIALFYTSPEKLSLWSLGAAAVTMGLMGAMNLLGVRRWWIFGIVGLALWYFVLESGVHATIAGVMGALTIPVRTRVDGAEFTRQARRMADEFARDLDANPRPSGRAPEMILTSPVQQSVLKAMEKLTEGAQTPLQRLEKGMLPLAAFLVVPVFALANAGVAIGDVAGRAMNDTGVWGIVLGLVLGKSVGIMGSAWLAVRFGLCTLPQSVTWRHMLGASLLAGIGFTMSLFVAHLAFGSSDRMELAKFGVLVGSSLAAVLGAGVLLSRRPPTSNVTPHEPA